MSSCILRAQLQKDATETLNRLIELNKQQIDALQENDETRLMALDQKMELAFGDKERAFGALREHTKEHGC